MINHPYLANVVKLKKCRDLNPKPPMPLGVGNHFQESQWILMVLLVLSTHKNLTIIFSKQSHGLRAMMGKQFMEYLDQSFLTHSAHYFEEIYWTDSLI